MNIIVAKSAGYCFGVRDAVNMAYETAEKYGNNYIHFIFGLQEITKILLQKVYDLRFVNTICFPTKRNHERIKELSIDCDIMIVIGSFTSANSKRLTELAVQRNNKSYQVTGKEDLKKEWFKGVETVGISAGASTPDYLIEEVKEEIKRYEREICDE